MEELIELYLIKNNKCPLPTVGSLHLIAGNAIALYGEGKISAPVPTIKLQESELSADDFIEFIALKKSIPVKDAADILNHYCSKLQQMDAYSETKLPNTGKFYVDADGNLIFKSIDIPQVLLPELTVERVIYPASSHAMVVGDKETTTTEMAAFYSDIESKSADKWQIWATCLAVVAAALLGFHYKDKVHPINTGNSVQIEITPDFKTYRIAE